MKKTSGDPVRTQYETLPYPPRNPDDERNRLITTTPDYLQRINHFCYGGSQDFKGFRAIVAGCGTGDSGIFLAEQLVDKDGEVVFLDISSTSLDIAQKRARTRKLHNVSFIEGSLLDLPRLELKPFDYINCVGVLHHLEDPLAGLKALRSVLKPDGCMGLMVYALYGRLGVYAMQDLLRIINGDDDDPKTKITRTRSILQSLPNDSLIRKGLSVQSDHNLFGDAGLYDLFLHARDRAFTIREVFELLERAELHFAGFPDERRMYYYPATHVQDQEILGRLNSRSRKELLAAGELMTGSITYHGFYVTRQPDRSAKISHPEMVPFFFPKSRDQLHLKAVEGGFLVPTVTDMNDLPLYMLKGGDEIIGMLQLLDGLNTSSDILEKLKSNQEPAELKTLLRSFLNLWKVLFTTGWVLLRHASIPDLPTVDRLQRNAFERLSGQ